MNGKNKGKSEGNFNEKSLFFFFPASYQLESVFKNYKVLKELIIIGQNLGSLEGINELRLLEELWIVECNLIQENVEPIGRCLGLKRLYLYNNELSAIPNLELLEKLSHLWLSDNQLQSFQGINTLVNVRELCLSNNNIATVDTTLSTSLKIVFLNLSGNPIKSLKEIQKLRDLRRLRWLVLLDPLFRTSPISLLANLRSMVIHCLPGLEKLDMLHISQAERTQNVKFFDEKLEYYRLSLHNSLAKLCDLQKTLTDLEFKELEIIWNALKSHCPSTEKDEERKSNNLRFWEDEAQRWKKKLKLLYHKFDKLRQVIFEAVNCEVESCGNLQFLEVDLTEHNVQDRLKMGISSFMCSHLRKDVLDVSLQNAWYIQGHCQITVLQSQFQDSVDHIYIVTPVEDLGIQPLKFIEDILFGNVTGKEFLLTTCLAEADPLICDNTTLHRQLLLQSQTLLNPRMLVVCGVSDPSQLTVQEPSSHGCHQWLLSDPSVLVPLYLLHYHYVFQDYFKPLRTAPVVEERTQVSLPLPLDTKQISPHITELKLTASNLHKLDIPVMEHVRTLDISNNQFENISSVGLLFPNLTSLNVAFNRIQTLCNLKGLTDVTHLTLSWNFLSDFLSTLRSLKSLKSLKHVDLSSNPFTDVICDLHQQFFVCKILKSLITFNDCPLSRSVLREEVTLQGQEQFPMIPACTQHNLSFSLRWRAKLFNAESENHLGVFSNQVISITMKDLKLTQIRSVFSLSKVKWLDLSENLFYGSSPLKGLPALEEVNLSHNVIEAFSCLSEGFKHLTKLNLSYNYISSLTGFTCEAFPQLKLVDLSNNKLKSVAGLSGLKTLTELYLSHNCLQDPNTLTNCKGMKELRVLDVSYNPLTQKDSFKSICLYYINSLKYINGCKVRLSETKSAITLFEGLLDQDYLLRIHKRATIDNLTQLSLSNCSIKKVVLQDLTLPNVTLVTLDHNQISSLSWVQSFPNLKRLNLSNNRVSSYVEDCSSCRLSATCHISSLMSLVLDHNHIKQLSPLKLELFPNLQFLVLNNNEISSLLGLKNNSQIEHLVLDKNKLSSISCDQTEQLESLLELYVEHNSLSKLDFLRPLKKLRKLFLGYNKLVARSALDPLTELPKLEELTVHGNPIFRFSKSYRDYLPSLPSLQLLEGHPVNKSD